MDETLQSLRRRDTGGSDHRALQEGHRHELDLRESQAHRRGADPEAPGAPGICRGSSEGEAEASRAVMKFAEVLRVLEEGEVSFILIGGVAAVAHGAAEKHAQRLYFRNAGMERS